MKRLIFMVGLFLLQTTTIFCNIGNKIRKFKSEKEITIGASDLKKNEKNADALIINFFLSKEIKLGEVPSEMKGELEFKRGILIKNLNDLAKKPLDEKTKATMAQNFTAGVFEEFVQRVKYIKISDWSSNLINAIREKRAKNTATVNSSYPELEDSKKHLLKNIPK